VTVRRIPLRLVLAVTVLAVALACAPSALARGGAGHNSATKKLEDAFKIALYVRSVSLDGCYPPVKQLAKKIADSRSVSQTAPIPSAAGMSSSCSGRAAAATR
jgi:hypothetical protein